MECPSVHPIKRAESHLWLSRPSRRSAPSASRRTGGWLLPVLAAAIIFAPPFAPTAGGADDARQQCGPNALG